MPSHTPRVWGRVRPWRELGRLCGFVITLPEDEAGPTIQHDNARQIAEATAQV
jgi:hypothetical protein